MLDVSIISCTNKPYSFDTIISNYKRQSYEKKELIIILNNNRLSKEEWTKKAEECDNVRLFQLDENISLGECLNFGIKMAKYNIIAKFDDDDYYGSEYLSQAVYYLNNTEADVVGKSTSYVYFRKSKTLAVRNHGRENRYVPRVEGPTLVFKKDVINVIKFKDKNLGEDVQFCRDCCRSKIKIYSTDKNNFVYIRNGDHSKHTWCISDKYYLKLCNKIGQVDDYRTYAES